VGDLALDTLSEIATDQTLLADVARRQSTLNWTFAAIGLAMFFTYVLLNAFAPTALSAKVPGTESISLAIALGYFMIIATVVLTGIYVYCNNRYVEPLLERLRREHNA
jgi:uncharacterized membrane protein (DUF485 family)